MLRHIPTVIFLLGLWIFIHTAHGLANDENAQGFMENMSTSKILESTVEHHGLQRNLGFSNFLEGWLTPWETYEEDESQAPRVPLLRITPAFFKREFRFNYIYVNDERRGEADVNEWGLALELPLTLRIKVDIEPKILYVHTNEDARSVGFGDTKLALRIMLLESKAFSLSTGSILNVPTGEEDRHLGNGVTAMGQQLAYWMDMGHRMSLHTFLGVDVPTGGKRSEDAHADFLYGVAFSKTFTVKETPLLENITPFIELNGHRGFGLDEDGKYRVTLLPGVRWALSHELYVMPV